MKKALYFSAVLVFCFSASCWSAPILTADDFSPIVQANTEQERKNYQPSMPPKGVKTEVDPTLQKPITTAATAQDAINSVMQRFYAYGGEGCESIRLPDGEPGLVAVGVGTYGSDMKNIVAQRREQQLAYIANGDISNGKAAELLGMSKTELLDMFGSMGIPYYTQTSEELDNDIQVLRNLRMKA